MHSILLSTFANAPKRRSLSLAGRQVERRPSLGLDIFVRSISESPSTSQSSSCMEGEGGKEGRQEGPFPSIPFHSLALPCTSRTKTALKRQEVPFSSPRLRRGQLFARERANFAMMIFSPSSSSSCPRTTCCMRPARARANGRRRRSGRGRASAWRPSDAHPKTKCGLMPSSTSMFFPSSPFASFCLASPYLACLPDGANYI